MQIYIIFSYTKRIDIKELGIITVINRPDLHITFCHYLIGGGNSCIFFPFSHIAADDNQLSRICLIRRLCTRREKY